MKAEIMDTDDTHVGLKVFDNDGHEHRLTVRKDNSDIDIHKQDKFPHSIEERTDDQNTVMARVEAKAKTTAHHETEADILPADWQVSHYERAIRAIESCPNETFEQFRPLYDAIQNPPVDVPLDRIEVVTGGFTFTDDDQIDWIGPVLVAVAADDGGTDMRGPDPERDPDVIINQPVYEDVDWAFEDRFRDFLVHHLKCQIRDIYLNRGDDPPEQYQVKGYGKIAFNGMKQYDEIRQFSG